MIRFTATIQQFAQQGEKTGWTYIEVPKKVAEQLQPNHKKSFRVKGLLDDYPIQAIALLPMGEGNFIMALNASMRKAIKKRKGDQIIVQLALDTKGYLLNADFIACLDDAPEAKAFFDSLTKGHQNYFSKWIDSAKTTATQTKRIAMAIHALTHQWDYATMIRNAAAKNNERKQW